MINVHQIYLTVPAQVTDFNATSNSSTFIYLKWKDVDLGTAEKKFLVCRGWEEETVCENVTDVFFEASDLSSNTLFTFNVSGINKGGRGNESERSSITCKIFNVHIKILRANEFSFSSEVSIQLN